MSSTENVGLAERVFGTRMFFSLINFQGYTPNNACALAAGVIYGIIGVALLLRVIMSKAWWGLCLPIGAFSEELGYILRHQLKSNPNSLPLFATEQLFTVCAPAAFLAFNYITYGRLIAYIGTEHSIMNPQKVAKMFVISDIFTLTIQALGSSLETSQKLIYMGNKIVLVGLILQTVSYGFFCFILVRSHLSIKSAGGFPTHKSSIVLIYVMYFSSAMISIRCIYRVAEFAQGFGGYLLRHEVFLYALDVLPLLLAIVVYIPFWPTKYILNKEGGLEMMETAAVQSRHSN